MALNLGLSRSYRNSGEQQQEIKEARKFLKDHIRSDWEYPPLPRFRERVQSSREKEGRNEEVEEDAKDFAEKTIAGFKFRGGSSISNPEEGEGNSLPNKDPIDNGLDFEPTEWRERSYSTSESSDGDESAATTSSNGSSSQKSHYKFDGPDSVGATISARKLLRKRKRRKQQDEEVTWNDGLAHWLKRRDAWCAARTEAQVRDLERRTSRRRGTEEESVGSTEASVASTPRTSTSTSDDEDEGGAVVETATAAGGADASARPSEAISTTPATTPELHPEESSALAAKPSICAHINPTTTTAAAPLQSHPPGPNSPTTTMNHDSPLLLPVTPQLLPNHPVRRRITPETYPEIYTKIIIQSRNPSVPINLLTMVRALVQGWKEDGEWPPKNAVPEKGIARKKNSRGSGKGDGAPGGGVGEGLKSSVKAVGRVLRITGSGGSGGNGGNAGGEVAGTKEREREKG